MNKYSSVKFVYLEKNKALVLPVSGSDMSRKKIIELIDSLGDRMGSRKLGDRTGDAIIFCGDGDEMIAKICRNGRWYKASVKTVKQVRTNYQDLLAINAENVDRMDVTDEEDTTEVEIQDEGILCGSCGHRHATTEDVRKCHGAAPSKEIVTERDAFVKTFPVHCKGWSKMEVDGKDKNVACKEVIEVTRAQLRAMGMSPWYCDTHKKEA